jgi:hypothetical protein
MQMQISRKINMRKWTKQEQEIWDKEERCIALGLPSKLTPEEDIIYNKLNIELSDGIEGVCDKKKKDRSPSLKIGDIRVRYQQIPYKDRYYLIDIKDNSGDYINISKIRASIFKPYSHMPYMFFDKNDPKDYDKFLEKLEIKVKEYDKYLDKKEN